MPFVNRLSACLMWGRRSSGLLCHQSFFRRDITMTSVSSNDDDDDGAAPALPQALAPLLQEEQLSEATMEEQQEQQQQQPTMAFLSQQSQSPPPQQDVVVIHVAWCRENDLVIRCLLPPLSDHKSNTNNKKTNDPSVEEWIWNFAQRLPLDAWHQLSTSQQQQPQENITTTSTDTMNSSITNFKLHCGPHYAFNVHLVPPSPPTTTTTKDESTLPSSSSSTTFVGTMALRSPLLYRQQQAQAPPPIWSSSHPYYNNITDHDATMNDQNYQNQPQFISPVTTPMNYYYDTTSFTTPAPPTSSSSVCPTFGEWEYWNPTDSITLLALTNNNHTKNLAFSSALFSSPPLSQSVTTTVGSSSMRVDPLHLELVVLPVADRNHIPLQQLPWYVARPSSTHNMTTATLDFSLDYYAAHANQKENDSNNNRKRAREADEEKDNVEDNESDGQHRVVIKQQQPPRKQPRRATASSRANSKKGAIGRKGASTSIKRGASLKDKQQQHESNGDDDEEDEGAEQAIGETDAAHDNETMDNVQGENDKSEKAEQEEEASMHDVMDIASFSVSPPPANEIDQNAYLSETFRKFQNPVASSEHDDCVKIDDNVDEEVNESQDQDDKGMGHGELRGRSDEEANDDDMEGDEQASLSSTLDAQTKKEKEHVDASSDSSSSKNGNQEQEEKSSNSDEPGSSREATLSTLVRPSERPAVTTTDDGDRNKSVGKRKSEDRPDQSASTSSSSPYVSDDVDQVSENDGDDDKEEENKADEKQNDDQTDESLPPSFVPQEVSEEIEQVEASPRPHWMRLMLMRVFSIRNLFTRNDK